jgi:hypothetical protein
MTDPYCACASLGFVCLRCRPTPPRVWPREEKLDEGRCGACGGAVTPCLRGFRCVSSECGAIAPRRAE